MIGKTCKGFTGFTLVEMLVVVLIFSIVMGVSTSIFTSALKLQKYNLSQQQLLSQTSYIIEYMSRAVRMAKAGGCASGNYEAIGSSLKFETYHNECWRFYLSGDKRLIINKGGVDYFLTSDDFTVNEFKVTVSGDSAGSQPRVTIYLDIEGKVSGSEKPGIKIQTTISQRNLNL